MILEPKKTKSVTVFIVSLFAMKWCDQMPWSSFFECWVLSQLFHSSLSLIKRHFSSSLFSAIKVVSSAYLRLLIFLPAILIPACASSSPVFLSPSVYSECKVNKQGDNIQPWRICSFSYLEPVCCSMSSSNWCFLTCIQVSQEAGVTLYQAPETKSSMTEPCLPGTRGPGDSLTSQRHTLQ